MSLANLVMFNDERVSDEQISDLLNRAPLMRAINAVPASNGTNHRYKKTTTGSSAGFRAIDAGLTKTKSASTQVDVVLKVLDATFSVDVAEADAYRGGRDAYLEIELMEALAGAFFKAEQQLIYGTGTDSDGFAGLTDNALFNALADAATVGAGGTDSNAVTSCWLLRSDDKSISYVAGNDGNIQFNTEEATVAPIVPLDSSAASYPAYYVPVTGWGGLQIGNNYAGVRICNLDAGSPLTDDLISQGLELFPAGQEPNLIACSRQSRGQLQRSRTATNATGAPAPVPMDAFGIPLITTDAIVNTEAVVA